MLLRLTIACLIALTTACASSPDIPQEAIAPQTTPLELARQELNAPETPPERKLALSVQIAQMLQASPETQPQAATYYKQGASLWLQHNVGWEAREDIGELGTLAATSFFELGQMDRKLAQSVKLQGATQTRALRDALEARTKHLIAADKHYAKAAVLSSMHAPNSALRARSLYEMGRQYDEFSQALLGAPLPQGLSQEQLQLYTEQIRSYAAPLSAKARKHYKIVSLLPVDEPEGKEVVAKAKARLEQLEAQ